MEFFDCKKKTKLKRIKPGNGAILSLDISKLKNKHGEAWTLKKLSKLSQEGILFSIYNLKNVKNLFLYSILNTHPIFVGLNGEEARQTITLIEDFNSFIDIGMLNTRTAFSMLKVIHKKFVVTDAVLSGVISRGMWFELEEVLSRKDCLIILSLKAIPLKELAGSITRFVARFGEFRLAVCRATKRKITRLKELLRLELTEAQIENIFRNNAIRFFKAETEISLAEISTNFY